MAVHIVFGHRNDELACYVSMEHIFFLLLTTKATAHWHCDIQSKPTHKEEQPPTMKYYDDASFTTWWHIGFHLTKNLLGALCYN